MTPTWRCEHATTLVWTAQLSIQAVGTLAPGQLVVCRACVLKMAGYPAELTATLDRVILEKRFGQVKVTFQNGVPGVVYFDDALKVKSWQPWPRKNWLGTTEPDMK